MKYNYEKLAYSILFFSFIIKILYILVHYNDGWEPDTYNHVLFAKSVFVDFPHTWSFAVGVWQKPLYTMIVAIWLELFPSGVEALPLVQILNIIFWLVSSLLVMRILKKLNFHEKSVLVGVILMSFTFVLFRASMTANTEIIGMFFFVLGLFYWVNDKKYIALLLFGLLPLVRTDAVFFIYIFPLAFFFETYLLKVDKKKLLVPLTGGVIFSLPLLLWNYAGYLTTGSPLFLLTHGYPTASGIYGYGKIFHYVVEFIKADTALFILYWIGVLFIIRYWKNTDIIYKILLIATLSYFSVMSIMWVYGGFGTAGLLRYFVFAYPSFIIIAVVIFEYFVNKTKKSIINITILIIALLTFYSLHWLIKKPQGQASLYTSVPKNNLKKLPYIFEDYHNMIVYTDYPAIAYYLHKNFADSTLKGLNEIDEKSEGYVFFTENWSNFYSKIDEKNFTKFQLIDEIKTDYLSTVRIYKIKAEEN